MAVRAFPSLRNVMRSAGWPWAALMTLSRRVEWLAASGAMTGERHAFSGGRNPRHGLSGPSVGGVIGPTPSAKV
jgi:hypothetical protein